MYNVRLKPSFTGPSRRRAGLELLPAQTLTVELTDEQLESLASDDVFIVTKSEAPKAVSTKKPKSKK
jgi:hypothetical protein